MIEATHDTMHKESGAPLQNEDGKTRDTPFAVWAICVALTITTIVFAAGTSRLNTVNSDLRAQLVQANSAADQARADLAKANARSVDIQQQLERTTSSQGDLQSRLNDALNQQKAVQAQLDAARADLRTSQDNAKSQILNLQAQYSQVRDETAGIRKELERASAESEGLKVKLAKALEASTKTQTSVAAMASVPVAATFEKSFWKSGFTLHMKNLKPTALSVSVTVSSPVMQPPRSETIQGGESLDIRDIAAGSKVIIESSGYDPVNVTAE
jgi:multidrug efflux pump subunit AcrA (membrane-fusion protein)